MKELRVIICAKLLRLINFFSIFKQNPLPNRKGFFYVNWYCLIPATIEFPVSLFRLFLNFHTSTLL
jgi:hypothetical protein